MIRKLKNIKVISFFLIAAISIMPLFAQNEEKVTTTRILFLLDASGSMRNSWDNSNRMAIAKNILKEIIDTLGKKENVQLALRAYGHQSPEAFKDCKDTRLEIAFGKNTAAQIKNKLNYIRPKGTTPIAYSLEKAAGDFPRDPDSRNIVILITDGIESCDGDPCAISLALQKRNVFLKPFVIGLGLGVDVKQAFDCMGAFYNAKDPSDFKSIMKSVINRSTNITTAQVNLLDSYGKPTETDANMTFYDSFSGVVRENYYHSLNYRGHPDTLSLDPVNTYDIVVHTIPPVSRKGVELTPDQHNIININAPQGYLELMLQSATVNNNINNKIKCLVRKPGEHKTMHVQQLNTAEKMITGKYDLEFLTLPRIEMKGVDISQNKTTTIRIPTPGLFTLIKSFAGTGSIFIEKNNKLEKVYELNQKALKETIALQPGTYRVIFRAKYSKKTESSVEKTFIIKSGTSSSLKL